MGNSPYPRTLAARVYSWWQGRHAGAKHSTTLAPGGPHRVVISMTGAGGESQHITARLVTDDDMATLAQILVRTHGDVNIATLWRSLKSVGKEASIKAGFPIGTRVKVMACQIAIMGRSGPEIEILNVTLMEQG